MRLLHSLPAIGFCLVCASAPALPAGAEGGFMLDKTAVKSTQILDSNVDVLLEVCNESDSPLKMTGLRQPPGKLCPEGAASVVISLPGANCVAVQACQLYIGYQDDKTAGNKAKGSFRVLDTSK